MILKAGHRLGTGWKQVPALVLARHALFRGLILLREKRLVTAEFGMQVCMSLAEIFRLATILLILRFFQLK